MATVETWNQQENHLLDNLNNEQNNITNVGDNSYNNRLLPFPIEVTELIIYYAYHLDPPNLVLDNENDQDTSKVNIPLSARNLLNGSKNSNLNNLMLVNSYFYFLCLQFKYKYCKFIRSFNFHKFLQNLLTFDKLGDYVEVLDFQEFTAIGLGKSIESIIKIPNLTNFTLLQCLKLCNKNLKTLLLSESIDNDINLEILNYIFNNLKNLKSLDFCGVTNYELIDFFNDLKFENNNLNYNIQNLSFHECTSLPDYIFHKFLPFLPNLKKLDLSHTQITLKSLNQFLNPSIKLTHLNLRKCTNLGTFTDFIKFLKSKSICNINNEDENCDILMNSDQLINCSSDLKWLNIQQCFSSDILNIERLDKIIDIIINCNNLKYLNLNGFANLNCRHIEKIIENLPNLESLNISDLNYDLNNDYDYLIIKKLNSLKNLKYLDLSLAVYKFSDLKIILNELDNIEVLEIRQKFSENLPLKFQINDNYWRIYNNKGTSRRCWIHKIKSINDCKFFENYETEECGSMLYEWDLKTGGLLVEKVKKVDWLGLGCVKINLCDSEDDEWGNELNVRGLYKYYSLKV